MKKHIRKTTNYIHDNKLSKEKNKIIALNYLGEKLR